MSQEFDVNTVLREALQKIVDQSKENGLKLFKEYIPALLSNALFSIDYWALGSNIDISEKCIIGEVAEFFQKLVTERQNAKNVSVDASNDIVKTEGK